MGKYSRHERLKERKENTNKFSRDEGIKERRNEGSLTKEGLRPRLMRGEKTLREREKKRRREKEAKIESTL